MRVLLALMLLAATAVAQTDLPPAEPQPQPGAPTAAPQPQQQPQPPQITKPALAPQPQSDDRKLTIMWAPLRAIFMLAEVTVEYRVADKVGVMLELGGGRRDLEFENMVHVQGTEWEAGLQGRYYLIGSFTHGMELGAELLEEYVKFDEPLPPTVAGAAAGGLTAGAFVGYKIATRIGFTFEGQLGARYLVMDPEVTGMGTPMIQDQSKWLPLLHLNVGWTF